MKKLLLIVTILFLVAAPNRTTSQSIAQKPSQNDSTLVIVNDGSVKRDTMLAAKRTIFTTIANAAGGVFTGNREKPK
jgi:fructose-specific component phosphotransferase system IIB-like protein